MQRISVIIPTYNLEDYLEAAVDSVLAQSLLPVEILIVDNNSTDNTLETAHRIANRSPVNMRVLSEKRQGAPYARNTGLSEAKGEWLQYLDGDDLLMPDKLQYQSGFIEQGLGFIASTAFHRDIDGTEEIVPVMGNVWKGLFFGGGCLGYTSSNLFNREAMIQAGGWDTSLPSEQEFDMMFRILQSGYRAIAAPEIHTIKLRRQSGQISQKPYAEKLVPNLVLRTRILKHLLSHPVADDNTMREIFELFYLRYHRLYRRRRDYARKIREQHIAPVITDSVLARYPYLRRLQRHSYVGFLKYQAGQFIKRLTRRPGNG